MTVVDGRVRRGARNREAIVDALIACYEDGDLQPSVPEVAARAGVSVRSVHNHFEDVEALRVEVARRQWERHVRFAGDDVPETIEALVERRSAVFESVTPVRRAALLSVHDSPAIARNLAHVDRFLRRQLQLVFPGVDDETLEALDLVTSWDAWNRLRTAQGCSVARARRVLVAAIRSLTEGESA